MAVVGGTAFGVTNWGVQLAGGSAGEAESAAVTNVTISAQSTPSAANLLYPGGDGDVVVAISNPNSFPVTVTAVELPANTSFASGFSSSSLAVAQTGCSSGNSGVLWNFATSAGGSGHTLITPITVAANGTRVVTFVDDASMGVNAPAACEGTFFVMPSLAGVLATGGDVVSSSSPLSDGWVN